MTISVFGSLKKRHYFRVISSSSLPRRNTRSFARAHDAKTGLELRFDGLAVDPVIAQAKEGEVTSDRRDYVFPVFRVNHGHKVAQGSRALRVNAIPKSRVRLRSANKRSAVTSHS